MDSKKLLKIILVALLLNNNASAQENRIDYNLNIPLSLISELTVDMSFISNILLLNGISHDEESEILTHNEEDTINITCFNCIISDLPFDYKILNSHNDRIGH